MAFEVRQVIESINYRAALAPEKVWKLYVNEDTYADILKSGMFNYIDSQRICIFNTEVVLDSELDHSWELKEVEENAQPKATE